MLLIFSTFFLMVFFSSIWKMNHLLSFLISLEMMTLIFFFIFNLILFSGHINSLILLFFLLVAAMESVMGLVLFVLFVRYWGKDYIVLLSLLKF